MKTIEFVKKIWGKPNMSDETAEHILWTFTGFPTFFRTENIPKEMAKGLRHAKRSLKRGFSADDIYVGADTLNERKIRELKEMQIL